MPATWRDLLEELAPVFRRRSTRRLFVALACGLILADRSTVTGSPGCAANLLELDAGTPRQPAGHLGPPLEGFVAMELSRQLTWSRQRAELYHYRTRDNIEVDLVLENRRGQVIAIKIKASSTVKSEDFRGLRHLADRLDDDLLAGIVLYTGQQTLPFGPRFRAMPVSTIWEVPTGEETS